MADGEEVMDSPVLLRGSVRNLYNKGVVRIKVRLATSSFSRTNRALMSSERSFV